MAGWSVASDVVVAAVCVDIAVFCGVAATAGVPILGRHSDAGLKALHLESEQRSCGSSFQNLASLAASLHLLQVQDFVAHLSAKQSNVRVSILLQTGISSLTLQARCLVGSGCRNLEAVKQENSCLAAACICMRQLGPGYQRFAGKTVLGSHLPGPSDWSTSWRLVRFAGRASVVAVVAGFAGVADVAFGNSLHLAFLQAPICAKMRTGIFAALCVCVPPLEVGMSNVLRLGSEDRCFQRCANLPSQLTFDETLG